MFSGAAMLLVDCIWFWFEVLANFLCRQACFCIAAFGVIIGAAAAAVTGAAGFAAATAIAMLIFMSVFAVGALLPSTIFLGLTASGSCSGNVGDYQTLKLAGPIDLRLSFGSYKATASNTSTPAAIHHSDVGGFDINIKHFGVIGKKRTRRFQFALS